MAEYTIDKIEYNGDTFNLSPNVVYATCPTAAGTAAKVATITSGTLTSLNAGDQVIVKFTYANGKASPTLKVGSTDAKSIMRYGTTTPGTSAASSWNAGSCILFVYDGTYWQQIGFLNSTYTVTDKKLEIGAVTSGTTYYPIVGNGTTAATRQYDSTGFEYSVFTGTTEAQGGAGIRLGNSTATGTDGNKKGFITIYGTGSNSSTLYGPSGGTGSYNVWLPNDGGTLALTTDIPDVSGKIDTAGTGLSKSGTTLNHSNSVTAQTTQAVYPIKIDAQGHISAYGSAVTIPTVPSNIVNTITTTAGTHTAITSQKGNVSFNVPTKTSHLTNDSGFITSAGVTSITTTAGAHTAITSSTGAVSFKVPTTAAHVGAAASDHTHGNITNGGDITATAPTIASGDQIIINDHSASKITNGPTFDGSTTTTALTPKGTWETFSKFSGSYNDLSDKPTIPTNTDEKIKLTSQSTSGTYPLIFGPTSITSNSTYQGYYNTGITVNPSTKTVTATTFVGALTGTASGNLTSSSTLDATKLSGTIPSGCYTNTTYGISGSLSNHAFTSTLTAGGSGTTSVLTLAAGTGITLTDDTTNKKITIACSVTNTDTKVSTAAVTSGTAYYPVLGSDTTSAATKFYDKTGFQYVGSNGTANNISNGRALLTLGNSTAYTSANWKRGAISLYGIGQYAVTLAPDEITETRTITIPNKSGVMALTSDITTAINTRMVKPNNEVNAADGWLLKYMYGDPYWQPPDRFIIGVSENVENPGTYYCDRTREDLVQAITDSTALEVNYLDSDDNSTMYVLRDYRIENQYIEIGGNTIDYQIVWFSGTQNYWLGGKVRTKTILCGIYIDNEEYPQFNEYEALVKISDDITASGKMYFGPENDELRGVKFNTIDSSSVQISANSTATITATYTPPQENQRTFLTGAYVRATGTNYSRVFLYGLGGTRDDSTGAYTFTCYGRNTYSSAATVSVRFRFLTVTVLDSADSGDD